MKVKLYNRDINCKSINAFVERYEIINITASKFLDENRDLIFYQLTFTQKLKIQSDLGKVTPLTKNDLTTETFIPCPCELVTDADNLNTQILIKSTNALSVETDVNNFIVDEAKRINERYDNDSNNKKLKAKVLYWGKYQLLTSYSSINKDFIIQTANDDYSFIDLTKYIKSINTSVSEGGGNFSLNLSFHYAGSYGSPIYRLNDSYDVDKMDITNFFQNIHFRYNSNINNDVIRDWFNTLFNINDLFLIKLYDGSGDDDGENISDIDFDMIGLVDGINVSVDANGNAEVALNGSDLMKLIKNDGSYFFNIAATNSVKTDLFNNPTEITSGDVQDIDADKVAYGNPFKRLRLPMGQMNIFMNRNLDIATIILGAMNILSNIKIAPDALFDIWGDKRTKKIEFQRK